MSMNISGLGNAYSGVNTNSKQYKALKEKGWLEGVIQNEAMMSPEEKMIYEIFGGRDTIVNNLMKQFDSDGDLPPYSNLSESHPVHWLLLLILPFILTCCPFDIYNTVHISNL